MKPSNLSGPKELHIPKNRKGQYRTYKGLNIATEKKNKKSRTRGRYVNDTYSHKGFYPPNSTQK